MMVIVAMMVVDQIVTSTLENVSIVIIITTARFTETKSVEVVEGALKDVCIQRWVVKSAMYRVPQKYRLKVYGSEGHKNGANQILILCMFFSTSGHLV